ncbi:monothiol glutaredoxin [Candidatus Kinetoplastibacterium desouzaii TCC079E]|uniref:Glutaredoxin n=1 Tax=Candidatus Kinetoplastidibacterium desouzai TCC079E TaxID=1208919 RepID=M1L1I6_9PROT|nr:Grx4 family monothiol glutaredoxin [Candidatus Kinetoplastibacterium desouzaii]AGF46633.1 monothiol glutaredoxin [Candidatus Kinetoplastibacterium desouzaii TCC079E]
MKNIKEVLDEIITHNSVVLFMKGSINFPLCGFSGKAVKLLRNCGVSNIYCVNVLEDDRIRQGIKDYSNWPTIPQLYINSEFIGGVDIMSELYDNGELKNILNSVKNENQE